MFEFEIEKNSQSALKLTNSEKSFFNGKPDGISKRTILNWGEHCTECVYPSCYTTCDFYSPRSDGKCRRFSSGLNRIEYAQSFYGYLTGITFKKWAKLWAEGNLHLFSVKNAARIEQFHYKIASRLKNAKHPQSKTVAFKILQNLRRLALNYFSTKRTDIPDFLLIEVYNPNENSVDLNVEIRPAEKKSHIPFLKHLQIKGFQQIKINVDEIARVVNLTEPFGIDVIPDTESGEVTLYFGAIEFVKEPDATERNSANDVKANKVKAMVWDLDNTIWDGILVEDGRENIKLKPGITDILQKLDKRGIINSIASKNNFDDAMAVLDKYHIRELFLFPQITWGTKSQAIKVIADKLNININTLAFIDDSSFERAEVSSEHPDVLCIDARDYHNILQLPEFDVTETEDASNRRRYYQAQIKREQNSANFHGNYFDFLKNCDIKLDIRKLSESGTKRAYELTQRTNQMNFSGNRYTLEHIKALLHDENHLSLMLNAADKFGSYGTVGFAVIKKSEPRLKDLMFSCRVQSKRIEHAFISYLLDVCKQIGKRILYVDYKKTNKNKQSGKVFEDFGFQETKTIDGVTKLAFHLNKAIPDDDIVNLIIDEELYKNNFEAWREISGGE